MTTKNKTVAEELSEQQAAKVKGPTKQEDVAPTLKAPAVPKKVTKPVTGVIRQPVTKVPVPKPKIPNRLIPASYSKVIVTQRALLQMASHVVEYPNMETAFDLLGLLYLGENDNEEDTAIITTVVPPSPLNIVRGYATVKLGGDDQALATNWFINNAKVLKRNGTIPDAFYPAYLHAGHSHHELGFNQYSGTDIDTIINMVKTVGLRVAVGPLLNIRSQEPKISQRYLMGMDPKVVVDWKVTVDVRFYLYTKKMAARHASPITVSPTIVDDFGLPPVPPLSWRYTMPVHFAEQVRHIQALGCVVKIQEREIVAGPPFETQFILSNPKWAPGTMVSIITGWDFPKSAPEFKMIKPGETPYVITLPDWEEKMDFVDILLNLMNQGAL